LPLRLQPNWTSVESKANPSTLRRPSRSHGPLKIILGGDEPMSPQEAAKAYSKVTDRMERDPEFRLKAQVIGDLERNAIDTAVVDRGVDGDHGWLEYGRARAAELYGIDPQRAARTAGS
jgi:hypothetical protein